MELAKSCPAGEAGTRTVRGRATRAVCRTSAGYGNPLRFIQFGPAIQEVWSTEKFFKFYFNPHTSFL